MPIHLSSLKEGEFIGTTVEGKEPFFWSRIHENRKGMTSTETQPFAENLEVRKNFEKVKAEAEMIVVNYQSLFRKERRVVKGKFPEGR